jgi:hypothetical protein
LLTRFSAVLVDDSSVIGLPDALAAVWQGCGDAIGGHLAALKLAVRVDLRTGTLHTLALEAGRVADRASTLQRQAVPVGALRLADLGYFAVGRLREIAAQQGFFFSRLHAATAVYQPTGGRLELASWLRQQATPTLDQGVLLGAQERLAARLLAWAVPQEVADQRRRRLREEARRRGRTVRAATLALADWTILVTNIPPDRLSVDEAPVLVRVRWQIELLFKLWKSAAQIDNWRTTKPWRILCEVYAKLIGVLIQHWLLIAGCWAHPDRSLLNAAATVRDHALLLAYGLRGALDLVVVLDILVETLHSCPPVQRRAKHPATFQLLEGLLNAA